MESGLVDGGGLLVAGGQAAPVLQAVDAAFDGRCDKPPNKALLVADALRAACRTRCPADPVVFHSDRGCQYTSREFALPAGKFDVRLSVGRTGQCRDNALAESFFATLKRELPGDRPWSSRAAARTAIFEWIEAWYNMRRLHSGLGYRSPVEYETVLAA
ncbi:transposase [Kitasatospora sp. NPDC059722]|uniref:transposase n=1 Tax=Kitasatospora sp. NPDC059722 TaxID=3346925 RepID=UPI00368E354B